MQPLEYKNIGGEEHLTYDSIRRLALHELSEISEKEARKHIEICSRCRGIYQSLAAPSEVRESFAPRKTITPMLVGLFIVIAVIGLAASILYFGSESKQQQESTTAGISGAEILQEPDIPDNSEEVAPVIEAIDTLAQIQEEPDVDTPLPTNKQFDEYIEKEQVQPRIRLRGIYGKITADGQPIQGVSVRVPGSSTSRVTDEGGKYYIQVPRNAKSLIFTYRGKQLVKELDPDSRRLDILLKSESLSYPENQDQGSSS